MHAVNLMDRPQIAALFVLKNSHYFDDPRVLPYSEGWDARNYKGPWPVIAHPPCARWCLLAPLVQAIHGYKIGDDGGLFKFALDTVRKFGGVLEHPAYSLAWAKYGLTKPLSCRKKTETQIFTEPDEYGGYSVELAQRNYGHAARKLTWLYIVRAPKPTVIRGLGPAATKRIGAHNRRGVPNKDTYLKGDASLRTPEAFNNFLVEIALSAKKAP